MVEYQINIFPIVDLASAKQALRLIVEEGEGIDSPPDFQRHFLRFFKVHDELLSAADRELLRNPAAKELGDIELFLGRMDEIVARLDRQLTGFMQGSLSLPFGPAAGQASPSSGWTHQR